MADITVNVVVDDLNDFSTTKSFPSFSVVIDDVIDHTEPMPAWLGASTAAEIANFLTVDRAGVISGTVKIQGVLQGKSQVNLYFRKSGQLIQSTFTDADGVFLFKCGLNRNVADYYAVAITEQPFNAQIFDKLQPG